MWEVGRGNMGKTDGEVANKAPGTYQIGQKVFLVFGTTSHRKIQYNHIQHHAGKCFTASF